MSSLPNKIEEKLMAVDGFELEFFKWLSQNDLTLYEGDLYFSVKDYTVDFYANCSDLFYWATSDAEQITEANFEILRQSYQDLKSITSDHKFFECDWFGALFCARVRNMRPQGAFYKHIPEVFRQLFDEAGPEREVDMSPFGNPMSRDEGIAHQEASAKRK